jgi:pyruvate/2-oxoglutarate dehydrogenase complex dihydrolipoamide acyltransferase (E2) component
MPTPIKMPRLGESVAERTIRSWLKQEGEMVEKDEALAEVITDKFTADWASITNSSVRISSARMRRI